MSHLSRLVPLVAAGAAILTLAAVPVAEAGPRDGRKNPRVEQSNKKPEMHNRAPRTGGHRDPGRNQGFRHDDRRRDGRDQGYRHDDRRQRRRDPQYRHDNRRRGYRTDAWCAPRYRAVPRVRCAPPRAVCGNGLRVVTVRPWWEGAPRVYVQGSPYFFHAGLGVYLGGLGLSIQIGNAAPAGYGYLDPYCGLRFDSLEVCRTHAGAHGHDPVVEVVAWAD